MPSPNNTLAKYKPQILKKLSDANINQIFIMNPLHNGLT